MLWTFDDLYDAVMVVFDISWWEIVAICVIAAAGLLMAVIGIGAIVSLFLPPRRNSN